MIKTFVNKNVKKWDQYISLLLVAYRSTPHPATGFSPNCMMLEREVYIPVNLIYKSRDNGTQKNEEEYISTLKSHFQEVYEIARENFKVNAERQKRDLDTRLTDNKYEIGYLVYNFDKTVNRKFQTPWLGPFIITKILSSVVYEISDKSRTEVVHQKQVGVDVFKVTDTKVTQQTQTPAESKDTVVPISTDVNKNTIYYTEEEEFVPDHDEEIFEVELVEVI
ncbi:unnamed protein product [Mytilus coruscus]|uniref:Integrase catalytic domain-containing protein n=1 Tax=Mytilus coruscus TaxID=42192 RepID=A0A6J8CR48_MYTCO|nr:unnamed protein product [Mytilus coruscus]